MISIIIPTHNRSDLLQNAIRSVINQTYQDIEVIVVDDASIYDNKSFIDSFDSRIIYYRYETNQGGNVCRNKGVKLSSGEFVAFLDDDDTWKPDKLQKQISLIQAKEIDLCYTGKSINMVGENLQVLSRRYSFAKPKYSNLKKSIMRNNFIGTTSSIIIKKEKFLKVGGFDVNMSALQDYDFYIRFIHAGFNVVGIDEGLVDYFIYKKKNAISKSMEKKLYAVFNIIKKNIKNNYLEHLILSLLSSIIKTILVGHR